jgi:hypothetical protein
MMDGILSVESSDLSFEERKQLTSQLLTDSGGTAGGRAINSILNSYATADPKSGVQWVGELPEGKARDTAIEYFSRQWGQFDPAAASDWIARMPEGRSRDLAAKELVLASMDDLEVALANAGAISDQDLLLQTGSKIVKQWRKVDPRYLTEALGRSGLPKECVAKLQAQIPSAFFPRK